jgi:hypothetical protein
LAGIQFGNLAEILGGFLVYAAFLGDVGKVASGPLIGEISISWIMAFDALRTMKVTLPAGTFVTSRSIPMPAMPKASP